MHLTLRPASHHHPQPLHKFNGLPFRCTVKAPEQPAFQLSKVDRNKSLHLKAWLHWLTSNPCRLLERVALAAVVVISMLHRLVRQLVAEVLREPLIHANMRQGLLHRKVRGQADLVDSSPDELA